MARETLNWCIRMDSFLALCLCVILAELANGLATNLNEFRQLRDVEATLILLNATRICSYCAALLLIFAFVLNVSDGLRAGGKESRRIEDKPEGEEQTSFSEADCSSMSGTKAESKLRLLWLTTNATGRFRLLTAISQATLVVLLHTVAVLGILTSLKIFVYSSTWQQLQTEGQRKDYMVHRLENDPFGWLHTLHDYNEALYSSCCGILNQAKVEVCTAKSMSQGCVFSMPYYESLVHTLSCENKLKLLIKTSSCRSSRAFMLSLSQLWENSTSGALRLFWVSLVLGSWLVFHAILLAATCITVRAIAKKQTCTKTKPKQGTFRVWLPTVVSGVKKQKNSGSPRNHSSVSQSNFIAVVRDKRILPV